MKRGFLEILERIPGKIKLIKFLKREKTYNQDSLIVGGFINNN